jgi:DNA repair exonuclease SbcCD ATPase subunit
MTTTTNAAPTADQLRAEQAQIEGRRRVLAAIAEVRAFGGRRDMSNRDGGPLHGIAVGYDGTVRGLPGIAHADEATAQLAADDERLAEIDALLPEAEQREQDEQLRAQRRDERRREQQIRDAVEAVRTAAGQAQEAEQTVAETRAAFDRAISAGPLGEVWRATQARNQARQVVGHALNMAGGEDAQRRVLKELGEDARRALPGLHPEASRPAEPAPLEFGWLIDAVLNLPSFQAAVSDHLTRAR